MSKTLILNGAQPYTFAPGGLNATLAKRARHRLEAQGHEVRLTTVAEGHDEEDEVETYRWADMVIMQFPVNWMEVPRSFEKYRGGVYTAGMDRRLSVWDGRTADAPGAPERQIRRHGSAAEYWAIDVFKNPDIEADLARFDAHLDNVSAESDHVAA